MGDDKYNILINFLQQGFVKANLNQVVDNLTVLKKYAPSSTHPCLLDIGVGEGPDEIDILTKDGYNVTGISIQKWMLRENIFLMDMCDQKFPPESFDVAYANMVFEHCYNPWLAIMETWVTLRVGGVFFNAIPFSHEYLIFSHPTMLTLAQWERIYRSVGFEIKYSGAESHSTYNLIIGAKSKSTNPEMVKALMALEKLR